MAELVKTVRRNPLQAALAFITLANVVAGLILFAIAYQLRPILEDMNLLDIRVVAIEKRNETVDPLVTRFIQLEERDAALIKDVAEIKADVQRILKLHIQR